MPTRSIAVLSSALVILAASLSAATAAPSPKAHGTAPAGPSVRTLVDGVASDWDAGRRLVSLDAPDLSKGSKVLRRAVKRGATITLKVTAGTRLIAVGADGHRARITAAELFDELDLAEDEVDVEAAARVPRTVRVIAGEVVVPATRVVVQLPPVLEDDPDADADDPGWDDGGAGDDLPVTEEPVDDPGDA